MGRRRWYTRCSLETARHLGDEEKVHLFHKFKDRKSELIVEAPVWNKGTGNCWFNLVSVPYHSSTYIKPISISTKNIKYQATYTSYHQPQLCLCYISAGWRAKNHCVQTICSNTQKHRKSINLYLGISPFAIFQFIPYPPDPSSAFRIIKISHKYRTCKIGAFLMRVPDLCNKWE